MIFLVKLEMLVMIVMALITIPIALVVHLMVNFVDMMVKVRDRIE